MRRARTASSRRFQRLTAGDLVPIGISRNRASTPATVGSTLFMCLLEPAAFIMTRKMLLRVKRRAEATAAQTSVTTRTQPEETRMTTHNRMAVAGRWLAAGASAAAASYAAYAATTWWRYGRVSPVSIDARDSLLDQFMPTYEVAERHHVRVDAPADVTLSAAGEMHFPQPPIVRAIFGARALVMRSQPVHGPAPGPFLSHMQSIGWGVLAEVPGREVVMGAVTQPWKADVVFRPLRPDQFRAFTEPDHVKIAWTLRADPLGAAKSMFRTETRVVTTDRAARTKFRRYWAVMSPGIIVIRWALLGPLKREAERRHRSAEPTAAL